MLSDAALLERSVVVVVVIDGVAVAADDAAPLDALTVTAAASLPAVVASRADECRW